MYLGEKRPGGRTMLLIDVESGSVGGALVRIQQDKAPQLFAERRAHLPVRLSRTAEDIFGGIKKASHQVLSEVAEVAARLRQHPKTSPAGQVEQAAVFLGPPWGVPDLMSGTPRFNTSAREMLMKECEVFFDAPASFYTSAGALYRGARQILPYERDYLLVGAGGETSEIVAIEDGAVVGHATFPAGSHAVVRTLRAHADLTPSQARELLSQPLSPRRIEYREPLGAAADHFASAFAVAAEPLVSPHAPTRVFTAAHAGSDFFAQSLSHSRQAGALFPNGGTVRALRPTHAAAHLSAHAAQPDLWLMLEALFATAL